MFSLRFRGSWTVRLPADDAFYGGLAASLLERAAHRPSLRDGVTHIAQAAAAGLGAWLLGPGRPDGGTWVDDWSDMSPGQWTLLH